MSYQHSAKIQTRLWEQHFSARRKQKKNKTNKTKKTKHNGNEQSKQHEETKENEEMEFIEENIEIDVVYSEKED